MNWAVAPRGAGGEKQLLQQISMSIFRNLIYRRGHAVVHLEGREFNSRLRNLFGHTMALRSTQPLTEMNTRQISWGQRRLYFGVAVRLLSEKIAIPDTTLLSLLLLSVYACM